MAVLAALAKASSFYFRHLPVFRLLPEPVRNPDTLDRALDEFRMLLKSSSSNCVNGNDPERVFGGVVDVRAGTIEWRCSTELVDGYNADLANLSDTLRQLLNESNQPVTDSTAQSKAAVSILPYDAPALQVLVGIVRLVTLIVALAGFSVWYIIAVASLQIALAPLSLLVSLGYVVALGTTLFVGHFLSTLLYTLVLWSVAPAPLVAFHNLFVIRLQSWHLMAFVLVDQALCILVFFLKGTTRLRDMSPKDLVFAFFNTKTYQLTILAAMSSFSDQIPLLPLVIDAVTGLSAHLAKATAHHTCHWAALFYHQHRIAHAPGIYKTGGHKWHHMRRDTTSFDAHVYGNGLPEELCSLIVELLSVYCGVVPPMFNYFILSASWANKMGHHLSGSSGGGVNNHCDHHRFPTKNLGIFNIGMDVLFKTEAPRKTHQYQEFDVDRIELASGNYALRFTCQQSKIETLD